MRLLEELGDQPVDLRIPEPASDEDIVRAHDPEYLSRLQNGELSAKEIRCVGLPWSLEMVRRARYSVGATIGACREALEKRVAVNLGGGTHHAFPDHGQGYCYLNDSAIASRTMQAEGLVRKVLIIDCDVHQGNGTAAIVKNDPTIFTFSIHGKNNFPYHKKTSDLDVALEDGVGDAVYLEALGKGLRESMGAAGADLEIFLAGADPYKKDRFGRLALQKKAWRSGIILFFKVVWKPVYRRRSPWPAAMRAVFRIPLTSIFKPFCLQSIFKKVSIHAPNKPPIPLFMHFIAFLSQ
jgi:acetoin utilization deacetylase AcuC-like enzyme